MWIGAAFVLGAAVSAPTATDPIPHFKGGKWGYADAAKHLVIPAIYDKASRFKDGRALVSKAERWGFIDIAGHEAVPVRYTYLEPFSEGLAAAGVDGIGGEAFYGFIDRNGKVVVPIEYGWVLPFSGGVARVEKGPVLDRRDGLVDTSGKVIVAPTYAFIDNFSEGLAAVYEEHTECIERFGFVDHTGRLVLPVFKNYSGCGSWSEGRCSVRHKGKYGFIDKTGAEVVPTVYDKVGYYQHGHATVTLNGQESVIDLAGRPVVLSASEKLIEVDADGLTSIQVGTKKAFVDKTGKTVIPPKYDWSLNEVCRDWWLSDGLRGVTLGDKHGFIDHRGREVVPVEYDCTGPFGDGLAAVRKGDLWGFVDTTGKVVIPLKYSGVLEPFEAGYAHVTLRLPEPGSPNLNKWLEGYVDHSGTEFFEGPGVY